MTPCAPFASGPLASLSTDHGALLLRLPGLEAPRDQAPDGGDQGPGRPDHVEPHLWTHVLRLPERCQGKSFEDYKNKIKADLKTAVMGSWAVWVPAHTINFAFIPPSQRLLYINSIQIG